MRSTIEKAGVRLLHLIEKLGLALVALATVVAIGQELLVMVDNLTVRLADLLLLFIYLEVLAMVGVYLQAGSLPVRMPLYIAMVALARLIVLDAKAMSEWELLAVAGAILIIAAAVLITRYGHTRFPYAGASTKDDDTL